MLTWSSRRKQEREAEQAAPTNNPYDRFVVPSYERGAPYTAGGVAGYADEPVESFTSGRGRRSGTEQQQTVSYATKQPYRSASAQQAQYRRRGGTYPPAGHPPQEWGGYYDESWQRSQRQEHVINADEGFSLFAQLRQWWKLNPYYTPNVVGRPQRAPHEYSFVRPFDRYVLGERNLSGEHSSNATISFSSQPLKGMTPPLRRRSTYRIDPVQYTAATVDENDPTPAMSATFTSPDVGFRTRSYRLE